MEDDLKCKGTKAETDLTSRCHCFPHHNNTIKLHAKSMGKTGGACGLGSNLMIAYIFKAVKKKKKIHAIISTCFSISSPI